MSGAGFALDRINGNQSVFDSEHIKNNSVGYLHHPLEKDLLTVFQKTNANILRRKSPQTYLFGAKFTDQRLRPYDTLICCSSKTTEYE